MGLDVGAGFFFPEIQMAQDVPDPQDQPHLPTGQSCSAARPVARCGMSQRVAGDGYLGEFTYMVECIRKKTPPAIVTGADGASAVEICEAKEKSIKTGQIVSLN